MTGRALFVDTSVLAYAVGGVHPQHDPCRAVIRMINLVASSPLGGRDAVHAATAGV